MLFNTYTFWIFYAVVFLLYWRLNHENQNRLLLVASYIFYGAWDWRFLFLILTSTTVDFFMGQKIHENSGRKRKFFLAVSVVTNLSILGFFKYYNFFSSQLDAFLHAIGVPALLPTLNIILPVGISFYTFQTMSYSIDVYRAETKPVTRFRDYALYVSFFPQLVAGPIERSSRLVPQVIGNRQWDKTYFLDGLYMVMYGLFLKVVVADNMTNIVNTIFAVKTSSLTGAEVLIALYTFAFQIYGDFAGYSLIARGVARWLGFDLMVNFRQPYFATNPRELWHRWHISLSSWFKDYVYIPLGGNRGGERKAQKNMLITMVLSGFWHGANWTYILWGFFHGILLGMYKAIKIHLPIEKKQHAHPLIRIFGKLVAIFFMFQLVTLGWLFFRARNIQQIWAFLKLLFTKFEVTEFAVGLAGIFLFYTLPVIIYEAWVEHKGLMAMCRQNAWIQGMFYGFIALMLFFFRCPEVHQFIYFQF